MKKIRIFSYFLAALFVLSITIADPSVYANSSPRTSPPPSPRTGGQSGFKVTQTKAIEAPRSQSGFSPQTRATETQKSQTGFSSPQTKVAETQKSQSGFAGPQTRVTETQKSQSGFAGPQTKTAEAVKATATTTAPATTIATPPRDAAAAAKTASISREQSQKAIADYKAKQSAFKQPPPATAINPSQNAQRTTAVRNVVVNNYHYDSGAYAYRSNAFYSGYGWHTPIYASAFYPNYGIWNTMSLLFMLDHMQDQQYAMMYYSHRNDEDMRRFRSQLERESQSNPELREKLAAMETRVQAMEQQGIKADPNYVPSEMKEIALSEDALKAADQDSKSNSHWILWTILGVAGLGIVGWFIFGRRTRD